MLSCITFAFAQKPSAIQINYTLNQLAQRIQDKQADMIIPMLSNEFTISFYETLNSKRVLTQLINQMPESKVSFSDITERNNSFYAKAVLEMNNTNIPFMVKMNEFLEFDRIGLFEILLKQKDPVINETSNAVLTSTLPIEIFSNMIFINLKVEGYEKPLRFLFDSGAGVTAIDSTSAHKVGIKINDSKTMVQSATGQFGNYYTVSNPSFLLDKTKFETSYAIITDLSMFAKIYGVDFDGIIGYDILRDHLIEVDLSQKKLNIYDGAQLTWANGKATRLPITITNNTPKVNIGVKLDQTYVNGKFMFDTGASSSIIFNSYFDMRYNANAQLKKPLSSVSYDVSGASNKNVIGLIQALNIGDYTLNNVAATVNIQAPGSQITTSDEGLLGMGIIKKFNILFNYPQGTIELAPNSSFKDPMTMVYLLGLGSIKQGKQFLVSSLNPDGLAFKAGIRNGDEIVTINQMTITSMNDLIAQLKLVDTQDITIAIMRNGNKKPFIIKKLK